MIVAGSDYLKQLEIVRKIRDTVKSSDKISLPQICVIGDQSSGKSSFLSRLTGVRFPTAAKMCTKAAVVVTCNRDTALTQPRYEIEDWRRPGVYEHIASTEEAIRKTQNELLQNISKQIGDNTIVSDQSIKLRVTGPDVIDIIVVDLPGIQHAGSTKDSILTLIEKNIEKPETLNLIVSEAKQDAELTKAIEIAAKYDPEHRRTIRVLSKFDNFDTPTTQDRAVQLILDGLSPTSGNVEEVAGHPSLGPHAVISIGKKGNLRAEKQGHMEESKQLTEEYKVPPERAGITTLMERLQPLFAILIQEHLPLLKQKVSDNLNQARSALEKIGREPKSPIEIVNCCHQVLKEKIEELERNLTNNCFLLVKDKIKQTKGEVTLEFATEGFEVNSFHCVLFQGQRTFENAVKKVRELWKPIVDEFLKKATEITCESAHCLRNEPSTKMYGRLISAIQGEHQCHMQKSTIPRFKEACYESLRQEGTFGTTNHYFDSKFREEEICPDELMDLAEDKFLDLSESVPHHSSKIRADCLRKCLEEAKTEIASKQVHTDIMETQKKRVFAAVKANFDVEKKTFVDLLLKNMKCVLLEGHVNYVEQHVVRSKKILDHAKEDEAVRNFRKELLAKETRLEECMSLLHDVPFPAKKPRRE